MSTKTKIQWCDSTVNPIMGCGGCELFLPPQTILKRIDQEIQNQTKTWKNGDASETILELIYASPAGGDTITTTNIYHARDALEEYLNIMSDEIGEVNFAPVRRIIEGATSCYAARLHLNKGTSIANPHRKANSGYAPTFEEITVFPNRMATTARQSDLINRVDHESPWKNGLPRMIFVSDMGDAFSRASDFQFLKNEALPAITSEAGTKHLWLWLTKRPSTMAKFADEIGGFPSNVCAMTTLTCAEPSNLRRVDQLRQVKAHCRGLSIEPLRGRIPSSQLDLEGIDWVIVGGESGARRNVHPFELEWAVELMEHCQTHGVAVFMKQYGRSPTFRGNPINLKHSHGGRWEEWPNQPDLRCREFPAHFHLHGEREKRIQTSKTHATRNQQSSEILQFNQL